MSIEFTPERLKEKLEQVAKDRAAPKWLSGILCGLAVSSGLLMPKKAEHKKSTQFIYFH